MAGQVDLNRVIFIVLREMRWPMLALIVVYAVTIMGMVFIPGPVLDGKTQYMSIFHAFYFMTYTATTTGFGEIPFAFSNAQRLWAIICLYISVITWFYAIGSIIRLFQNPFFLRAVAEHGFSKKVEHITSDYFIICGFGNTGSVLARGLSDAGLAAVIIDADEERIKALRLRNYRVPMPGLIADAGVPKHLLEAGIRRKNCKAIVAITNDEEINLKISALARFMNKDIQIITQSKLDVFEDSLSTLGGEVHIVDSFKIYASLLVATIYHPGIYTLNRWLVREKGASLEGFVYSPSDHWVICGYGRMGQEINRALTRKGIHTTVVDPKPDPGHLPVDNFIIGRATGKTLYAAGIQHAKGVVAATGDDGHNLGILLNSRTYNPKIYSVVRQNFHENEVAYDAANANLIMQPSLVTARRIMILLQAPLLKPFFKYFMEDVEGRSDQLHQTIELLKQTIGSDKPRLTTIDFSAEKASAIIQCLDKEYEVLLGDLLRDPRNRDVQLDLLIFIIRSDKGIHVLPEASYKINKGDQLLLCGTNMAYRLFNSTLNNEYTLYYVQTGKYKSASSLMRWYQRRRKAKILAHV
jgi:Trk K+ transport system NAD-binding subunit